MGTLRWEKEAEDRTQKRQEFLADTALLNAKARGRGIYQFFQPGMNSRGG